MIISRTPFRITLGGGGTDLPSYYSKNGGFLLTSAIDKYMYVAVNTPFIDKLLRVKYSISETVETVDELQHDLARHSLKHFGISDSLEILSFADISAGTGMGSSSAYLVGLLNTLQAYKRKAVPIQEMAELACKIEIEELNKPIGKQDAYVASYGGLLKMEIGKDGTVKAEHLSLEMETIRNLEHNLLLYYSGVQRKTEEILKDQHQAMLKTEHKDHSAVEKNLNQIKELGYETLKALESSNLKMFGKIMDQHWQFKKKISKKISNPKMDEIYDGAKEKGAIGGKLVGAGGGGFFLFYAEGSHNEIDAFMAEHGMRRLEFRFDFEGSKILLNLTDSRMEYQQAKK